MASKVDGLDKFQAQMQKFISELETRASRSPMDMAKDLSSDINRRTDAATGGNSRLSGMRNARVGTRARKGQGGALVHPYGPFHMVENDIKSHTVGRRKKKLKINGSVRTGPWHAGGSRGRKPFKKGVDAFDIRRQASKHLRKALKSAF